MNEDRRSRPTALAPQQAVQDYLNTLLQDATAQAEAEVESLASIPVEVVAPAPAEVIVPTPVELVPVEVPEQAPAAELAEVVDSAVGEVESPTAPATDDWVDGRPAWAQQRFECLLFKVSGLMLAVPLVELGGVRVIDQELTPLFGQPDWFLGLLPSQTEGTVKVIDTARWVMPERCSEQSRQELKYAVMMDASEWGLACHEVADAITLEPHQVNWRSNRGRRPWLAGTVIEHMCAIMDVAALVKLVAEQSRVGHSSK